MLFLFKKMKIHESALGFLVVIILFCTIGTLTIRGLFTLGNLTRTIYDHPLVVSNAALNAALGITKMHRDMKDVVLSNTPDEMAGNLGIVAENEQVVYSQLDTIRQNILGEEGQALEREARQLFIEWKPIRQEVVRLFEAGDKEGAVRITRAKGADHVARLERKMLELTSYARNKSTQFITSAESHQTELEAITVALTMAGVLFSTLVAFILVRRMLKYDASLLLKNQELQRAFDEIKTLRGIIPICSYCHQIRDDEGIWNQIDQYLHEHLEADFSHGICPDCLLKKFPKAYEKMQLRGTS
jgi:hypothetical protein